MAHDFCKAAEMHATPNRLTAGAKQHAAGGACSIQICHKVNRLRIMVTTCPGSAFKDATNRACQHLHFNNAIFKQPMFVPIHLRQTDLILQPSPKALCHTRCLLTTAKQYEFPWQRNALVAPSFSVQSLTSCKSSRQGLQHSCAGPTSKQATTHKPCFPNMPAFALNLPANPC